MSGSASSSALDWTLERESAVNGNAAGRPKLLFLCQTLPFPPDGGVNLRTFNILRLLARTFDVTALCFYRKAARITEADVRASKAGLEPYAELDVFPIPQEHSRLRLIADHVRSVISGKVYTRYAYASREFEARLRELLATRRFDLVHVDSLDLSAYLPLLEGLPVACTHHNVESDLLERRARFEGSWLHRIYLEHQAKLMRAEEKYWCERIDLNLAVSPNDCAALERSSPRARFEIIPNGVDTSYFQPGAAADKGIVFVGGYEWFPNRDAMEFFATEILPDVRARLGDPDVTWVGRAPEAARSRYRDDHGIALTGYVDDVRPIVHAAKCYVVPLRSGGGTRLKILDAWAMGKAVVSTSVGCEGLAAVDGENILIRDTPQDFATAVSAVLTDERLRTRLEHGARQTAVNRYDWDMLGRSLIAHYMDLLRGSAVRSM